MTPSTRRELSNHRGFLDTFGSLSLAGDFGVSSRPRTVEVYRPPGYERLGPLPVVYMNDGNTAFRNGGLSPYTWDAHGTVLRLMRSGRAQPVILVAVHPVDREHEYLHVREFTLSLEKKGGGLRDYARFLVALKGFIDAHYVTDPARSATAIVGSSHGGLASFLTGCLQRDHFGFVGAMSPSFWAGGVFDVRTSALGRLTRRHLLGAKPRPRFRIDSGTNFSLIPFAPHNSVIERLAARWSAKMTEVLQDDLGYRSGLDLHYQAHPQGEHDERSWKRYFGTFLETFYGYRSTVYSSVTNRRHSAVRGIQAELVKRGYGVAADGIYGPATRDAVARFQRRAGLVSDGITGPNTLERLFAHS